VVRGGTTRSRPSIFHTRLVNYRAIERVAYRTVLLVAALVLLGLAFQQLVTLAVAVLATVLVAILLNSAASRLERHRVPRPIGALLALLAGVAVFAAILVAIIPPFVEETNKFVNNVPQIANDLQDRAHDITGASRSEIGHRAQKFARRYTDHPEKLIGPLTSIGFGVAGVLAALLLMLIIAYYMAANPKPLISGMLRLFPPDRREHAAGVMSRLRNAWVGWMQGVIVDMLVTGVLLYLGLTLIGLDYALVFAVVSALLVLIPYYGAFIGGLPPVLFGLADSPGKGALALVVYVGVQQVESNFTIPLVMARTVSLHPAVIAIGVLVVGRLMGFAGLFVAVPVLSFVTIVIDEFWIKPMEEADRSRAREEIELPGAAEEHAPDAPPAEPFALEKVGES
jgi:predicted PurR-regulated permease PerM